MHAELTAATDAECFCLHGDELKIIKNKQLSDVKLSELHHPQCNRRESEHETDDNEAKSKRKWCHDRSEDNG